MVAPSSSAVRNDRVIIASSNGRMGSQIFNGSFTTRSHVADDGKKVIGGAEDEAVD